MAVHLFFCLRLAQRDPPDPLPRFDPPELPELSELPDLLPLLEPLDPVDPRLSESRFSSPKPEPVPDPLEPRAGSEFPLDPLDPVDPVDPVDPLDPLDALDPLIPDS